MAETSIYVPSFVPGAEVDRTKVSASGETIVGAIMQADQQGELTTDDGKAILIAASNTVGGSLLNKEQEGIGAAAGVAIGVALSFVAYLVLKR